MNLVTSLSVERMKWCGMRRDLLATVNYADNFVRSGTRFVERLIPGAWWEPGLETLLRVDSIRLLHSEGGQYLLYVYVVR